MTTAEMRHFIRKENYKLAISSWLIIASQSQNLTADIMIQISNKSVLFFFKWEWVIFIVCARVYSNRTLLVLHVINLSSLTHCSADRIQTMYKHHNTFLLRTHLTLYLGKSRFCVTKFHQSADYTRKFTQILFLFSQARNEDVWAQQCQWLLPATAVNRLNTQKCRRWKGRGHNIPNIMISCSQTRLIRIPLISHFSLIHHYLLDTLHW